MFQRTSLFTYVWGWLLMAGVPVLLSGACVAMVPLQSHRMVERVHASMAACNERVATELKPGVDPGSDSPLPAVEPRGLRPEYLASAKARAVYTTCLEDRVRL